jgi:AcrR family transcriptional regulator
MEGAVPRPSRLDEKRRELIPVVAAAFAELGYRRASTAELAQRCGVQENILYRLWPDKKAMFIASIDHVYDRSESAWVGVATARGPGSAAQRLVTYEARQSGQFGHARLVFAGLSELDDPDISKALARMYRRYQAFVREQVQTHRGPKQKNRSTVDDTAWALIGLGTVALIANELKLLNDKGRTRLMDHIGQVLLA